MAWLGLFGPGLARLAASGRAKHITKSAATKAKSEEKGDEEKVVTSPSKTTTLDLDTRHNLNVLPDYGGPLFTHSNPKLVQLDIRDPTGKLIHPTKWYDALRPGVLILASAELHVYIMNDDRRPGEVRKVNYSECMSSVSKKQLTFWLHW